MLDNIETEMLAPVTYRFEYGIEIYHDTNKQEHVLDVTFWDGVAGPR